MKTEDFHQGGIRPAAPTLADRYEREDTPVFMSGVQALVRLPIEQMRRDRRAGLRTQAFVTGYPGSPLGGYDIALHQAAPLLEKYGIRHLPGQNEELAATTLMGTQMLEEHPHPDVDGVVAYWYGKGSGLDRSGDAFKHGNFAGTSTHGAVVVLSGEDHEAKSSSVPYQQEFWFEHLGIPVLYPASVQEFLEYGLHAAALSRYSGCWVALKLVGPLCDGGEVVRPFTLAAPVLPPPPQFDGQPFRKTANFSFFPVRNIVTERQLYVGRHAAVHAYGRANGLNRVTVSGAGDRTGIVSAGKSYNDTRQALLDLGYDDAALQRAGIRVARIGLLCPLDADFVRSFAEGLERIIVVEEKRDFLERQIGRAVCELGPIRLLGKQDEAGRPLFPVEGGMDSDLVATLLARVLAPAQALPAQGQARLAALRQVAARTPCEHPRRTLNFCSGCPHNVSTQLAPGQVAWGAPGCHIFAAMAEDPRKRIEAVTQLGGEGLPWIGLAPYTTRRHVVQNLGDGALQHSSYQNIRFAVSAGVNITFRILFNGVIANTGGQTAIGGLTVPDLIRHLALEGVAKIVLVAREPRRYRGMRWPDQVAVRPATALVDAMKELEATPGTTVLIYDGDCANERRRRQKRGRLPAPTRFTVVNEDVCDNCGQCGELANCMSLQKVPTAFGPKTRIHQSSCNQDEACVAAPCPSFVTVEVQPGTALRRPAPPAIAADALPAPKLPALLRPYHVYVPGLGGTGVLTANAILAQAAALDGHEVRSYDQTGAAQKWGAVLSSLIICAPGQPSITNQVGQGKADLYLALDLLAAVDARNLACCMPGATRSVINTGVMPSREMIRHPGLAIPTEAMTQTIRAATDGAAGVVLDARAIAEGLFGDYMLTNMVAIGAAWQAGLLPVSGASIEAAIRLNGTAVEANTLAFRAGRLARHDPARMAQMLARPYATLADRTHAPPARDGEAARLQEEVAALRELQDAALQGQLALRVHDLAQYQDAAYARRYLRAVAAVAGAERALGAAAGLPVTATVLHNLHKVMAYKDEYEVARLLTHPAFAERVRQMFTGPARIVLKLQPPLLRRLGVKRKIGLGPRLQPLLRALAWLKFLRGTPFDPFGHTPTRRGERALVDWYLALVQDATARLTPTNRERVQELLSLPEAIRGYEEIKTNSMRLAMERAAQLRPAL